MEGGTMRKARKGLLVVLSGCIVMLLAAGSALAQSTTPTEASASDSTAPITFIEGTTNNMKSVNPWKALESPEYEVLALNFDMLENFDKNNLQVSPGLASSWTQSEDAMTWTFTIRDDVKWQDGQPLTADDIAWTYNTTLDCKLGNSLDYLVPDLTDSITATSPTTLVWKTKVPTTAPIRPPWVYIAPEHIYGNDTCDEINKEPFFEDGKPMVGSGPFQLTEWNKGESWTMTANKDYWGGAPQIDQFTVVLYNNSEAMVNALKNGEIDYVTLNNVDLFNQLQAAGPESGLTAHVGPQVSFDQMSFNMCDASSPDASDYCKKYPDNVNPAVQDPVVRTAISWAIDRQTLVDKVWAGYGSPGTTIVPPYSSVFHYEPTADEKIGFDIDKANQMLEDAGYVDTDNNGIRNDPTSGKDVDLRLILRSESEVSAPFGTYITGWLKQIGIKVTPEVLSDGKLYDAWYGDDYDMYIWGWGPDPDPDFILSTFTRAQCGGWSDTCYQNPAYDEMYKAQQQAVSVEDRQPIVYDMQKTLYKDIPEIVLDYYNSLEVYDSAHWEGLEDNISPTPDGFLWAQYTPYSALTLRPRGTTATTSGGSSSALLLGILGAVIVIIGVVLIARRRRNDEDMA